MPGDRRADQQLDRGGVADVHSCYAECRRDRPARPALCAAWRTLDQRLRTATARCVSIRYDASSALHLQHIQQVGSWYCRYPGHVHARRRPRRWMPDFCRAFHEPWPLESPTDAHITPAPHDVGMLDYRATDQRDAGRHGADRHDLLQNRAALYESLVLAVYQSPIRLLA